MWYVSINQFLARKIKLFKLILFLLLIYFMLGGLVIFIKPKTVSETYIKDSSIARFYSNKTGPDRGILMDKPLDSGLARLKIVDSAK